MKPNTPLYDALKKYADDEVLPFHMPGHKQGRGLTQEFKERMYKIDLTELPGLDNLHMPEGVIDQAQNLAAAAFGADSSFFLVNGTSCGILAMIMTVCNPGDEIIIPRDCHKSVVDGLILSGAVPEYIKPEIFHDFNISSGISTEQLEKKLAAHPEAKAVLITYPNYYGVCSDIQEIADMVHSYDKILMVDEAHGSHLYFNDNLPIASLKAGADICVNSLHKTLAALTQCSILHVKGDRVDVDRLKFMLQALQTTSPSYIFMACMDILRDTMQRQGKELLDQLISYNLKLRKRLNRIDGITLLDDNYVGRNHIHDVDITKLLINVSSMGMTGLEAEEMLRKNHNIQVEMSDLQNILCITTVADSPDMFQRLGQALDFMSREHSDVIKQQDTHIFLPLLKQKLSPRQCFYSIIESIETDNAIGRICAERIAIYPPGIPFICPGEQITQDVIDYINMIKSTDVAVYGAKDATLNTIRVVKE